MLYFDTSFLAPLILEEASSGKIVAFLRNARSEDLAVSHWTLVEFSSAIARHVRMGELDRQAGARAEALFEELVEDSFSILLPGADDFRLARRYLGRFETGLRAGDAFHLAIASNAGAAAIYSLDKTFLSAGRLLNLPTAAGITGV